LISKEDTANRTSVALWFIDMDWFARNKRSITPLLVDRLCSNCRKQYESEKKGMSPKKLLKIINGCCATNPEFVKSNLPVLERVFRLFLANGNTQLSIDEIVEQLNEKGGNETPLISVMTISRLLSNDHYYGLSSL